MRLNLRRRMCDFVLPGCIGRALARVRLVLYGRSRDLVGLSLGKS
jgi:hypothetical protein